MSKQSKMARWLAIALQNCDPSGLNDKDLELYNNIGFEFTVADWSEESSDINDRCEYSGSWDHCVTIEHD